MIEHIWLTEENVELLETMLRQMGMIPEGDAKRLIADLREMRKICERLVTKSEDCVNEPGIATCHLGRYCLRCDYEAGYDGSPVRHDDDCPIQQGRDMLEATAGD